MADRQQLANVTIENAQLRFLNFRGEEDKFNAKGNRNFAVLLPEDVAGQMMEDGWNVKQFKDSPDGEPGAYYIQVSVRYDAGRPPKIVLITSGNRSYLDEQTVEMLDYADISNVDLVLNPYSWSAPTGSGVKAYLKTMFVTIAEDELERKYSQTENGE